MTRSPEIPIRSSTTAASLRSSSRSSSGVSSSLASSNAEKRRFPLDAPLVGDVSCLVQQGSRRGRVAHGRCNSCLHPSGESGDRRAPVGGPLTEGLQHLLCLRISAGKDQRLGQAGLGLREERCMNEPLEALLSVAEQGDTFVGATRPCQRSTKRVRSRGNSHGITAGTPDAPRLAQQHLGLVVTTLFCAVSRPDCARIAPSPRRLPRDAAPCDSHRSMNRPHPIARLRVRRPPGC